MTDKKKSRVFEGVLEMMGELTAEEVAEIHAEGSDESITEVSARVDAQLRAAVEHYDAAQRERDTPRPFRLADIESQRSKLPATPALRLALANRILADSSIRFRSERTDEMTDEEISHLLLSLAHLGHDFGDSDD